VLQNQAGNSKLSTVSNRKWFFHLPGIGIILFVICYIIAAILYPGGSQFNAGSKGFSIMHNYWCNLLNENAINGEYNPGRPVAMLGMGFLSAAIILFWYFLPIHLQRSPLRRVAVQVSGALAGIAGFFIFGDAHDVLINLAFLSGLVALAETFIGLYTLKWKVLFGFGIFNLLLIVLNNILFYNKDLLYFLPLVQKFSFFSFLMWMFLVNLRLAGKA
jgi:phage shock protein PspC (stress-responsive transcriptional regulator)